MAGAALVTGATGFVGGALVRHLVTSGRDVVALSRRGEVAGLPDGPRPRTVRGDVLDADSLAPAMAGCDVVFHVAGMNGACLRDAGPLFRTNVEGTRNVLEAAARAGVSRLVHTSSAATIGEAANAIGTEGTPHRGWFLTAYERSKFDAERLVLERGPPLGLEVVCVNPASVQGPGRTDGTARLLLAAARGRLPLAIDTWLSLVDVDDCARGHVLAAERGEPGERYLLCGGSLPFREALRLVASVTGRRTRTAFIPKGALLAGATVAEVAARPFGRTPPLCREVARAAAHGHRYDGSRATRDLGLQYSTLEETVLQTVAWFRSRGFLPPDRTPENGPRGRGVR
jgi:dihydroflavonol-4-reductase